MISTWGELWAAVKQWWVTPLKWERKIKEEIKQETNKNIDLIHGMFDKDLVQKQRDKYNQGLLAQERERRRYDEWAREFKIICHFCENCKDVGCEVCSQWPMNQ